MRDYILNDVMVQGYLDCILWSECDTDEIPLQDNYDRNDFSDKALLDAYGICHAFRCIVGQFTIDQFLSFREGEGVKGIDESYIGHDIWLTRSGHGCGFWSRGEVEEGLRDRLDEAAKSFRDAYPVVSNGQICVEMC